MLTASFVGSAVCGGKTPSLFQAFPDLFEKEAEVEELQRIKNQMIGYAELWNAKRAREG